VVVWSPVGKPNVKLASRIVECLVERPPSRVQPYREMIAVDPIDRQRDQDLALMAGQVVDDQLGEAIRDVGRLGHGLRVLARGRRHLQRFGFGRNLPRVSDPPPDLARHLELGEPPGPGGEEGIAAEPV
jgi:hypothetical protein